MSSDTVRRIIGETVNIPGYDDEADPVEFAPTLEDFFDQIYDQVLTWARTSTHDDRAQRFFNDPTGYIPPDKVASIQAKVRDHIISLVPDNLHSTPYFKRKAGQMARGASCGN